MAPTSAPHHTRGGFRNPDEHSGPGLREFLRWQLQRRRHRVPGPEHYHFPLAGNDPEALRHNQERTTVTWIGHATLFMQMAGLNILTDPQFSERASPLPWLGPRRVVPPGIPLEALPAIDLVVVSHDHYDSLDRPTVRALRQREGGDRTRFLVPLGLGRWFRRLGIERVIELDWWEAAEAGPLTVTAFPVRHWSKRGLLGRNRTLWAGWTVCSAGFRFLFLGDTGYTSRLREVGERLGPFDLAAIPIGAYAPRWFMRYHHIDPEEAVQVMLDLKARRAIAIHWGTFILTDEPLDEPPRRLSRALQARGLAPETFRVLCHGETILPAAGTPSPGELA